MFVFAILITFTFILIISFIPVLVLQLYYTISEVEEQNYNMIDNVLNNGAEKAKKEADRKEMEKPHGRVSLKERLAEKKAIITGNDKAADAQENVKKNQREM